MAPVTRNKSVAPIFKPKIFREKMHCVEESTCETIGSFGALGIVPPRYAPVYLNKNSGTECILLKKYAEQDCCETIYVAIVAT